MENYKVVVIGTAGVGVTAITVQFVENHFVESYDPTIDDSFEKMMNFHFVMILCKCLQKSYK